MATQTFNLPIFNSNITTNSHEWRGPSPQIPIDLPIADVINDRYFAFIRVHNDGQVTINIDDDPTITSSNSLSISNNHPLSDSFLQSGSITLTVGSMSLIINMADNTDIEEPYQFTPDNRQDVIAFYNAFTGIPNSNSSDATVILSANSITLGGDTMLGEIIKYTDFNDLVEEFNKIYADDNKNATYDNRIEDPKFGWGGDALGDVTIGSIIMGESIQKLSDTLDLSLHRTDSDFTGFIRSVNASAGSIILAEHFNSIKNRINILSRNDRHLNLNPATSGMGPANQITRSTLWRNNLTAEYTWEFENYNHARYFFNRGGQLRLSVAMTGSSTRGFLNWNDIVTEMGVLSFGWDGIRQSTLGIRQGTVETDSGFYNLNSSTSFNESIVGVNQVFNFPASSSASWQFASPYRQINNAFIDTSQGVKRFQSLSISPSGSITIDIEENTGGGTPNAFFSDVFESTGLITIEVGGRSVAVNMSDANDREPYTLTPSNRSEVIAFYTYVNGLTGNNPAKITISFRGDDTESLLFTSSGPTRTISQSGTYGNFGRLNFKIFGIYDPATFKVHFRIRMDNTVNNSDLVNGTITADVSYYEPDTVTRSGVTLAKLTSPAYDETNSFISNDDN